MSKVKDAHQERDEAFIASLPIVGKRPSTEKEEKYLREVCEFEFYNIEEPGLPINFPYGDTRKHHNFKFYHGSKYRIPRHVARHIEACATPLWDWRPDGTGKMTKQRVGEKSRFQMRHVFSA